MSDPGRDRPPPETPDAGATNRGVALDRRRPSHRGSASRDGDPRRGWPPSSERTRERRAGSLQPHRTRADGPGTGPGPGQTDRRTELVGRSRVQQRAADPAGRLSSSGGDPPLTRGRRRLRRTVLLVLLTLAVLVVAAAVFVGVQLRRPVPRPVLQGAVPAAMTVAGPVPRLPWPAAAESAVAIPVSAPSDRPGRRRRFLSPA